MDIIKLDFSELEETGSFIELEREVQFTDLDYRGDKIEIPSPLDLDLKIMVSGNGFILTGKLEGILKFNCSRCLQVFPREIEINIEEELKKEDIEDLKNVAITDLLKKNIFLAVPIKPLCSEECKGLCSNCGQNLNKKDCGCTEESVDPRLAGLKDYLNDEE